MIWRYIFVSQKQHKPEELLSMLTHAVGNEDKEELLSVADQLIEQGRQEGLQEGLRGQRNLLLKLLAFRFGTLPEVVIARVHTADGAELDLWAERVLIAPTLTDVLGEG